MALEAASAQPRHIALGRAAGMAVLEAAAMAAVAAAAALGIGALEGTGDAHLAGAMQLVAIPAVLWIVVMTPVGLAARMRRGVPRAVALCALALLLGAGFGAMAVLDGAGASSAPAAVGLAAMAITVVGGLAGVALSRPVAARDPRAR